MQLQHETSKGTILFVKVPDDASNFELSKWNYQKQNYTEYLTLIFESNNYNNLKKGDRPHLHLSVKSFNLIGLTSEVTEKQAKIMLYSIIQKDKTIYAGHNMYYHLALTAFKSLMVHLQVYEVNPYEKPEEQDLDSSFYEIQKSFQQEKQWQEAQYITGKWIVLFKPND